MKRFAVQGTILCLLLFQPEIAGEPKPTIPTELRPRAVALEKGLRLSQALKRLQEQTGNPVLDRRAEKNDPILDLDDQYAFWPALQAIARSIKSPISAYAVDGHLALIDGPFPSLPTTTSGLFRFAVRGVTVSRLTEETEPTCVLNLEVAWEPRLQPILLDTGPAKVVYSADRQGNKREVQVSGRGQVFASQQKALEIEVRFPGPDRSVERIQQVTGKLRVIAPVKMLEFRLAKLASIADKSAAREETLDGVGLTLTRLRQDSRGLMVDVLIQNPPGGPQFESYQSWLDFNRIWLEKALGDKRMELKPFAEEQLENPTATRAAIRYHFELPVGFTLADWTLGYVTPGRMVELDVPYRLQDIPLP